MSFQSMNERLAAIITILFLTGCTSGQHKNLQTVDNKPRFLTEDLSNPEKNVTTSIPTHKIKFTKKNKRTLFTHPGLIFGIHWGGSRASNAGLELVKDGYYSNVLEVRSRKSPTIYRQMIKDETSSYLGIHYSLGASPEVIGEAIKASKEASTKLDKTVVYNAILVDPYGFSDFPDFVDPDSPHLGTTFVIASSNFSFLRPNMKVASNKVMEHKKIHYIYPEDFGLSWDHFGFLSAIKDANKNDINSMKVKNIFYFLVNAIHLKASSNSIEYGLHKLRQKYKTSIKLAEVNP